MKCATTNPACPHLGTVMACNGDMLWACVRQVQVSHGEGVAVGSVGTGVLDAEEQLEAEMMWS